MLVRSSGELRQRFQQIQQLLDFEKQLELISDNAARWNSELHLVERFLKVESALHSLFTELAPNGFVYLSASDITQLNIVQC